MKIIGHDAQIKELKKIIDSGTISNAYMFFGIKGVGKATVAKEFAKRIAKSDSYILIEPEEGVIKVDTIRKLKEEMLFKPTISDRKVAIIDDAECMNEQAQNALLKILEEPPEYVTIILVTSNKDKLLYTIKSRCIEFKFNPLSDDEIQEYFENKLSEDLIRYSTGSIGDIKKALDHEGLSIIDRWEKIFKHDSLIEIIKHTNEIKEEKYLKENLQDFLKNLLLLYHKKLKQGDITVVEAIDIIEKTENDISRNANTDVMIDRMIINLWKWGKKCKKL